MNERLKELAEQVIGFEANSLSLTFSVFELERFAKLVLQDEANGMRETYIKMIRGAVADEREDCAKELETKIDFKGIESDPLLLKLCLDVVGGCAQLIRARGNHDTKR